MNKCIKHKNYKKFLKIMQKCLTSKNLWCIIWMFLKKEKKYEKITYFNYDDFNAHRIGFFVYVVY